MICLHVRFHSARFTLLQFQRTLVWRVILQASDSIRQNVPAEISFVWTFLRFYQNNISFLLSSFLSSPRFLSLLPFSIYFFFFLYLLVSSTFSRSQYKLRSFSFSIYSFIFVYSYFLSFQNFLTVLDEFKLFYFVGYLMTLSA